MACRNSIENSGRRIRCKNGRYCPFQYWCVKDRNYKSVATKERCKYYEEAENLENKK